MKTIANLVIKFPKSILLVIFTITLIMGFGVTMLEIKNNQEAELPDDDPIVTDINTIDDVFGERTIALVGLQTEDVYNTATLQKIYDLSKELEGVEFIIADEINSIATVNNVKKNGEEIDIGPFMDEVPQSKEAIDLLKKEILKNETINGQFVSKDGSLIVIAAAVEDGYDQGTFYDAVQAVVSKYEGPENLYVTGEPIWLQDIEIGIKKDSDTIVPTAILIVLLGIFFFFRRIRATLLPLVAVILSIVWTMGMMGYLGLPMTVVSNALPVLMVAVASSYGIHIMFSYYENSSSSESREEIVQRTYDKVGVPIAVTGITTAVSTLSLMVFKVTSLSEFGLIAGMGIFFATILSLTAIPSLLLLLKRQENNASVNEWLGNIIEKITNFALVQKNLVLGLYFVLFLVAGYGISQVIVGEDFMNYFPDTHKGKIASDVFNEKLNGVRVLDIMIDSKQPDGIKDPEFYTKLKSFQNYLEEMPGVGSSFSMVDMVDEMNEAFNDKEAQNRPMTAAGIAQYLLLYSMSSDPGDFNAMLDDDYQKTKIQVMLKTSEPLEHKEMTEAIEATFNERFGTASSIYFGGDVMLWIAQIGYIVKGKVINILLSFLLMIIICAFLFRSLKASLFSTLPILISIIHVFGIMGLIGIRLEVATAMLTAISVGIGIDFSIHYLSKVRMLKREQLDTAIHKTANTTGKAITYDAISNMIGFSICAFSGFIPVQNFGIMLSLTMAIICLNTLLLIPLLLKIFKPQYFVGSPT